MAPAYHGDPNRNWMFWVFPASMKIENPYWDFR